MVDVWGKHYIKFLADFKSIKSELEKYTLDDAEDLWKALQARDKLMEGHEKKLAAAAISAYEAGVTSKKLPEFMKDKGFADAKKLLDNDRKLLVAELKMLDVHCDKCKVSAGKAYALAQDMTKALMADKTKDKNPEREKVKKLREGLMTTFAELTEANKIGFKPPKYMTVFDAQYDKLIDHLIADALKKGKDPEEQLEVPQPLTDKKLGALVKEAGRLGSSVNASILKKEAIEEKIAKEKGGTAPAGKDASKTLDPAAEAFLTKARKTFQKLQKVGDEGEALKKKFKAEIAALKERTEILKQFKSIEDEVEKAKTCIEEGTVKAKKVT
ncbi:MAG: hypothetical protein ACOH2H_08945 [Cypionkella sp.]